MVRELMAAWPIVFQRELYRKDGSLRWGVALLHVAGPAFLAANAFLLLWIGAVAEDAAIRAMAASLREVTLVAGVVMALLCVRAAIGVAGAIRLGPPVESRHSAKAV